MLDPLLSREVLFGVERGNKKPPICGRFFYFDPDFELGPVPPFGGPSDRVLVDWRLTGCEWLVFEAGMHEESIRLRTEDLLRVADAALADLVVG